MVSLWAIKLVLLCMRCGRNHKKSLLPGRVSRTQQSVAAYVVLVGLMIRDVPEPAAVRADSPPRMERG